MFVHNEVMIDKDGHERWLFLISEPDGSMRGACITRVLIIKERSGQWEILSTYLGINLVESFDGGLKIASIDVLPNVPSSLNKFLILLRNKIGFLGKICSCLGIAFHSQVVQDQCIDVAVQKCQFENIARIVQRKVDIMRQSENEDIVFSA